MRTLLTGGTILTCEEGMRVLPAAIVAIDGAEIVAVQPHPPEGFAPETIIDCSGCVVMPGMVNSHVHLGEHSLKGVLETIDFEELFYSKLFAWESHLTAEVIGRASTVAALESLRCGVTTVADMYHHAEATARAVELTGIRAVIGQKILGFPLSDPLQTGAGGNAFRFDAGAFKDQLAAACEFADRWHRGAEGRITVSLSPHATNTLEPWMLARVAEEAQRRSSLVHMHLAQMQAERDEVFSRHGLGCVDLLAETGLLNDRLLAAHSIFVSDRELSLLAEHRAAVAHNPIANAKDGGLVAPIASMLAHGVRIGLGTDAFHVNLLEAARFSAFLHRAHHGDPHFITAEQALSWATLGGARAVGLERSVGSLEPGKKADLVVIDMTALNLVPWTDAAAAVVYHAEPGNVKWVLVDGRVVVEEGGSRTVDPVAARREFTAATEELWSRMGISGGAR